MDILPTDAMWLQEFRKVVEDTVIITNIIIAVVRWWFNTDTKTIYALGYDRCLHPIVS